MGKRPVRPSWFCKLWHSHQRKGHLSWLGQLRPLESIANYGCWSDEPFALMWTLDATEIKVIELKEENLYHPREILKTLNEEIEGRCVEFILADMSEMPGELQSKEGKLPCDHFDLAYCEDVLYNMLLPGLSNVQNLADGTVRLVQPEDAPKAQSAVKEMARVAKPGGWVIAVEPKLGSRGIDISPLFEKADLDMDRLDGAPDHSYCYRKRQTPVT